MSVYINMEMPKDGFITITVTADGRVLGNSKKESGKFEYLYNEDIAKAIPVPEHGRLIQKSQLLDACYPHFEDFMYGKIDGKTALLNIEKEIKRAPTIIPANLA